MKSRNAASSAAIGTATAIARVDMGTLEELILGASLSSEPMLPLDAVLADAVSGCDCAGRVVGSDI